MRRAAALAREDLTSDPRRNQRTTADRRSPPLRATTELGDVVEKLSDWASEPLTSNCPTRDDRARLPGRDNVAH